MNKTITALFVGLVATQAIASDDHTYTLDEAKKELIKLQERDRKLEAQIKNSDMLIENYEKNSTSTSVSHDTMGASTSANNNYMLGSKGKKTEKEEHLKWLEQVDGNWEEQVKAKRDEIIKKRAERLKKVRERREAREKDFATRMAEMELRKDKKKHIRAIKNAEHDNWVKENETKFYNGLAEKKAKRKAERIKRIKEMKERTELKRKELEKRKREYEENGPW